MNNTNINIFLKMKTKLLNFTIIPYFCVLWKQGMLNFDILTSFPLFCLAVVVYPYGGCNPGLLVEFLPRTPLVKS